MATLTKGKTFTNGELVTPQKLHELVDLGTVSGIVNADISASAAIADTKLAQITTANKVANSATSAISANTTNTIVARDASGNFSAGTITAALSGNATTATTAASCSGNAATATTLQTARTINGVSFNGSANITVTADPNAHTHDDRYYTETEINTLLAGKQAAGSYAPATGIAPSAITGTAVITTDSRLSDARTPTSHTHDDRYYTETEINTLLAGKQAAGSYAASSHNHDASAITTGQLDNARTTATSSNTANTIVLRDSSKVIWADKVNASQVIPKGGSLIFNDTFGTDFQFLGNSNDDKLFLKASGIEILEIDNTNGYPIWKIKNDLGSLSKIGVFKTNPATALDVNGTVTANSFVTSSDYRLKTNLEPLTDAVVRLLQIPVHRFNWLADPNGQKVDGFLAHEAQAIVPEAVTGAKDAVDAERNPIHQGIDQSKLVPLLVAAVQELAARVAVLESK